MTVYALTEHTCLVLASICSGEYALTVITRKMCGILGLLLHDPKGEACSDLFEGLGYLQHRGQVHILYRTAPDCRMPAESSLAAPAAGSFLARGREWSAMSLTRAPSPISTAIWASDIVYSIITELI
jgi:hypothetical protein